MVTSSARREHIQPALAAIRTKAQFPKRRTVPISLSPRAPSPASGVEKLVATRLKLLVHENHWFPIGRHVALVLKRMRAWQDESDST